MSLIEHPTVKRTRMAALSVAAAGGAAWAHHAFAAEFDGKAPVLLQVPGGAWALGTSPP